jgi:transposase
METKVTKNIDIIKRDFRTLNQETQKELRRLAFVHLEAGMLGKDICKLLQINPWTLSNWIANKEDLETRNFEGKLRGRKEGEQRRLEPEEEIYIKKTILEKTPEDMGLGAALWTRRRVQELIKEETKELFPINTVGNQLRRWNLTAQRPAKVAYQQDMNKIEHWIKEEYPKITQRALLEGAIVKFSDETGMSLNTYYGKSYGLKGVTPKIKLPSGRTHISLISTMSIGGTGEFMLYKGGLNGELFIEFLKRQIKDSTQKIFLIVDNLRAHKSKLVKAWVERHKSKIELFFPATLRSTVQSNRVIQQYLKTHGTSTVFS